MTDTEDAPYDDGYSDKEYSVKVIRKNITLHKKSMLGLGVECYSHAYTSDKNSITFCFDDKANAEEFASIINLHCKK